MPDPVDPPANDTLVAAYDLAKAPPTYDFLSFLAHAEMDRVRRGKRKLALVLCDGPKHGFRDDTLPPDITTRRWMRDRIVRPAAGLAGASWVDSGTAPAPIQTYPYLLRGVVDAVRGGAAAPVFRPSPLARAAVASWVAGRRLVVITLREAGYWPARNSRLEQWRLVIEPLRHDARYTPAVVRDTAHAFEPFGRLTTFPGACFDLDIRAAFYEAAHLNIAVNNGPCHLMYFNPACRYLVFKQIVDDAPCTNADWWRVRIGLDVGEQYPWAGPCQRLAWQDDEPSTLPTTSDLDGRSFASARRWRPICHRCRPSLGRSSTGSVPTSKRRCCTIGCISPGRPKPGRRPQTCGA